MPALVTRYPIDVDLAKSSDTIDVQAQATGAIAAGAFAALDTFASTVFTAGGVKWLKAASAGTAAGPYVAKTKYDAFDQEVTTYTKAGSITLRYANGEGLMMIWLIDAANAVGRLTIGRASGISEASHVHPGAGTSSPIVDTIFSTAALVADYGVVRANFATDTLTFGVSGFDLYIKYNGVTLDIPALKGSAWRVMTPGNILFSAAPVIADTEGTAGFRNIAISYPAKPASRKSNFTGKVIDLTDYGMKSVETTGSISAASNQLTVASATGFAVGDQIIVATGGETALSSIYSNTAAAGRRGTIGVGGSYPAAANHYANQAARLAASPADGEYAELDTGFIYRRVGGAWQGYETGYFYFNMINPRPLIAKITAIAGNVLTLDTNATASTSGAQVTVDCKPAFKPLTDAATDPVKGVTLYLPKGQFWHSGNISTVSGGRDDWSVVGYEKLLTILQHPKGASWTGISIGGGDRVRVANFHMRSNHDLHGYGVTSRGDLGTLLSINGVNVVFSQDSLVENMKFSECGRAIASAYSRRITTRKIALERLIAPDQCYLQWQIDLTDSDLPTMEDCTLNSNWLLKTYEIFSSTGGVIRRCGGRNALYAFNSSQGFLLEDIDVVIEAGCRASTVVSPILDTNIIDINSNIANLGAISRPPGSGGIVRRPKIVIQGYMDPNNWVSTPINITGNADVLVEGTYNPLVASDGQRKGLIQAPRSISSGLIVGANSGARVQSDSQRTVVRNMRVQTLAVTPNGGATASAAGGLITLYHGPTATISGIAALGASGLGFCTLSTLSYWGGGGVIKVDNEFMEFIVTNFGTRTIEIKSRGFGGTTAATHSNGATATSIDYSTVENCIADVVDVKPTSTATGNITNAAYAAL